MKKPFVSLKSAKDVFAIILCIVLCVFALKLFKSNEDSLPAFSNGENKSPKGLYNLVETKAFN